jgi:hypothetical protein
MIHVKRNMDGTIEVHKDSKWLGSIEYFDDAYGIEIWSKSYKEWHYEGTYKTLKQAYKAVKELI